MTAEPRTRTRRRQIIVGQQGAEENLTGTTLAHDVQEVFRLQSIAADAQAAAKKALTELDERMKKEKVNEIIVPMRGQAPAILADYKQSAGTSTINPAKFFKLVTRDQFLDCVTVGIAKAKKIVSENALKDVTTVGPPGDKSLNVRVLPKNHGKK